MSFSKLSLSHSGDRQGESHEKLGFRWDLMQVRASRQGLYLQKVAGWIKFQTRRAPWNKWGRTWWSKLMGPPCIALFEMIFSRSLCSEQPQETKPVEQRAGMITAHHKKV